MKSPVRFMARGLAEEVGDENPRHCEPTGRANARPMTGSAKQSMDAGSVWIASLLTLLANDGEPDHDGGECDGSGGGCRSGRGGSRQAPALRPAIIQ
jgi:hypothetical protein